MFRKHMIFILIFAMMTTFLAPARFVLACQLQSQTTACPMMAAQQKLEGLSCCVKKATSTDASLSAPCCCKMQPAPTPPSLPELTIVAESPIFVLGTVDIQVAAPPLTTLCPAATAREISAPRGPPLPFASLRAPPIFS